MVIGKSFVFFSTCICYKLCSKSLLKELHRIKLLHIEIVDNVGRKKTKLLSIEFICTSHNSVGIWLKDDSFTYALRVMQGFVLF